MSNSSSNSKNKRKRSTRAAAAAKTEEVDSSFALNSIDTRHQNPQQLADSLLELLPKNATLKSQQAKTLLKAFDLVQADLQHRTNLMALESVQKGRQSDILFSGVAIPPDIVAQILAFLPAHDTVHRVSLVCKSLLAVARLPQLWHTLDNSTGLLEKSSTINNMTQLLELLKRPQFSSLKILTPAEKVQFRAKSLDQIAKSCPLLQSLDLGYGIWSHMKMDDKALLTLPHLFPHLCAVKLNTYKITDWGLANFCELMGDRLKSIRIYESAYDSGGVQKNKKLSDRTLTDVIGKQCPNLEEFEYNSSFLGRSEISEHGIIGLLDQCHKLQKLSLIQTLSVGKAAFAHMCCGGTSSIDDDRTFPPHPPSLSHLYVVAHEELLEDSLLRVSLEDRIDRVEIIPQSVHNKRIENARHDFQCSIFW